MKLITKGVRIIPVVVTAGLLLSFGYVRNYSPANWTAPTSANDLKNPMKGDAGAIAAGKKIYDNACAICHGAKGKGDGVAAAGLNKSPADHTSDKVQSQTDGAIFWKLTEGNNPMPAYKGIYSEAQRWQLVNYIRTLAKTKK